MAYANKYKCRTRGVLFALFLMTAILIGNQVTANGESPKEVVEKFCRLDADGQRLRGDTWREKIRPLILWPDEPGWDTVAVISDFNIVDVKTEGSEATVTVEYSMLGTTDTIDFYKLIKKKTVKFSLLSVDGAWKINQPDMMLPHVSSKTIIKYLKELQLEEPVQIKEQLAHIIQKILEAQ
jgi:hypothetical protein